MSRSTPRPRMPSLPAMMLSFRAPSLRTSDLSKPLNILSPVKMWQSASMWVVAMPCGAMAK